MFFLVKYQDIKIGPLIFENTPPIDFSKFGIFPYDTHRFIYVLNLSQRKAL